MNAPALVLKRFFPDLDERITSFILLIGALAVLALKEITLPQWSLIAAALAGAFFVYRIPSIVWFYSLVAYLPFSFVLGGEASSRLPGLNVPNLLMAFTVFTEMRRRKREKEEAERVTIPPAACMLLLFIGFAALAWLRSGWLYGVWFAAEQTRPFLQWIKPLLFCFLTFWVIRDLKTLKTVGALILVSVTVVALMALWEYLDRAGSTLERSRVHGIAQEPNVLGTFFVAYMFLFLGMFLTAPKKRYGWMLVPFVLCVRGMMVTFSRGAYLATIAGGLVTCWFRKRWLFVAATALTVFAITHPAILPSGVRYRIGMTLAKPGIQAPSIDAAQRFEPSVGNRVYVWRVARRVISEHPWMGVGYGAFPRFVPHYTDGKLGPMDAHNAFYLIAAEMGLPTLLVFLFALGWIGFNAHWLYRHATDPFIKATALGFLGGLAALVVANLFTSAMSAEETTGYFWILSGFILRAVMLERRQPLS